MKIISGKSLIVCVIAIVLLSNGLTLNSAHAQEAPTDLGAIRRNNDAAKQACLTGGGSVADQTKCVDTADAEMYAATSKYVKESGIGTSPTGLDKAIDACNWLSLGKCVFVAVYAIMYVAGLIAGIIFTIGGWFITRALELNSQLLQTDYVIAGWTLVRDLSNLGLVFALIIIAFATILRIQSYGAGSTLAKLIAVALLINFSLTFAGVIMDFAGVISQFFLDSSHRTPVDFATDLANMFGIQNLLDSDTVSTSIGNGVLAIIYLIASLFFVVIFTLIAAITMLGIGVMFLVRFVMLVFYLVGAPLAMFALILPATRTHWNKWWEGFIRWTFFAPASLFFIWLTIRVIKAIGIQNLETQAKVFTGTEASLTPTAEFLTLIANMIVVCIMLVGGLIVADKMGIKIAGTFTGMAKGAAGAVGRWGGRQASRGATWPLRKGPIKDFADRMQTAGTNGNWATRLLTRPVRGLAGYAAKGRGVPKQQVADFAKSMEGKSPQEIARLWGNASMPERIAAIQSLTKTDDGEALTDLGVPIGQIGKATEQMWKYGLNAKAVEDLNPHFAPEIASMLANGNTNGAIEALKVKTKNMKSEKAAIAVSNIIKYENALPEANREKWRETVVEKTTLENDNPVVLSKLLRERSSKDRQEIKRIILKAIGGEMSSHNENIEKLEQKGIKAIARFYEGSAARNLGVDLHGAGHSDKHITSGPIGSKNFMDEEDEV